MPNSRSTSWAKRIRDGWARKHATPDKSLETVKNAVREQYEQEMDAKRTPSVEPPNPTPEREPQEPEP